MKTHLFDRFCICFTWWWYW